MLFGPYTVGLQEDAVLAAEFGALVKSEMRRFRKYHNHPKVYVVNQKVFYADRELTEQEISYLHTIKDCDQVQYDLDHHPDGSFSCR